MPTCQMFISAEECAFKRQTSDKQIPFVNWNNENTRKLSGKVIYKWIQGMLLL